MRVYLGPDLLPVDLLGDGRTGVPDEPGDLLQRDTTVGEQGNEAVPELPGRPLVGVDSVYVPERLAEGAAMLAASSGLPTGEEKTTRCSSHASPAASRSQP